MKKRVIVPALLCLALLLSGCGGAAAEPTPAAAQEPAPSPASAAAQASGEPLPDVDIDSWEFLVANSYSYIGRYSPPSTAISSQIIDERIADQTRAIMDAAAAAGYTLYISASYRSFDYFDDYYMAKAKELGSASEAAKLYCPGGCSDHNTGLGIDFSDDKNYAFDYEHSPDPDFQDTQAYQWLLDNCQDYGFIQRYPEGKEEYYGLGCCPGHFRYVGVEAAKYIKDHGLCLEEFVALYK